MAFLRRGQRALTNLNPHNANRRWVVPNRKAEVAPPPIPSDGILTVGDAAPQYGFSTLGNIMGDLDPLNWEGLEIVQLFGATQGTLRATIEGAQFPSAPNGLTINFATGPTSFIFTWVAGQLRYESPGTTLADFLSPLLGTEQAFTVTDPL